jgi:predicted transcriptional regulator
MNPITACGAISAKASDEPTDHRLIREMLAEGVMRCVVRDGKPGYELTDKGRQQLKDLRRRRLNC